MSSALGQLTTIEHIVSMLFLVEAHFNVETLAEKLLELFESEERPKRQSRCSSIGVANFG